MITLKGMRKQAITRRFSSLLMSTHAPVPLASTCNQFSIQQKFIDLGNYSNDTKDRPEEGRTYVHRVNTYVHRVYVSTYVHIYTYIHNIVSQILYRKRLFLIISTLTYRRVLNSYDFSKYSCRILHD